MRKREETRDKREDSVDSYYFVIAGVRIVNSVSETHPMKSKELHK